MGRVEPKEVDAAKATLEQKVQEAAKEASVLTCKILYALSPSDSDILFEKAVEICRPKLKASPVRKFLTVTDEPDAAAWKEARNLVIETISTLATDKRFAWAFEKGEADERNRKGEDPFYLVGEDTLLERILRTMPEVAEQRQTQQTRS